MRTSPLTIAASRILHPFCPYTTAFMAKSLNLLGSLAVTPFSIQIFLTGFVTPNKFQCQVLVKLSDQWYLELKLGLLGQEVTHAMIHATSHNQVPSRHNGVKDNISKRAQKKP